jgi:hypothetical protein
MYISAYHNKTRLNARILVLTDSQPYPLAECVITGRSGYYPESIQRSPHARSIFLKTVAIITIIIIIIIIAN